MGSFNSVFKNVKMFAVVSPLETCGILFRSGIKFHLFQKKKKNDMSPDGYIATQNQRNCIAVVIKLTICGKKKTKNKKQKQNKSAVALIQTSSPLRHG